MTAFLCTPHLLLMAKCMCMSSASALRYSSYSIAFLISSAVMQSGMSMHDLTAMMVIKTLIISLSFFHDCVCINSPQ